MPPAGFERNPGVPRQSGHPDRLVTGGISIVSDPRAGRKTDRTAIDPCGPEDRDGGAEVLVLLAAGKSCPNIARTMGVGLVTVRNHLKRIFPKLHVHSQAEVVSFAFRNKLI